MNIFIDESGSFEISIGRSGEKNFNCVAAVLMDDDALGRWEEKYASLPKASQITDSIIIQEILDFLVIIRAKVFFGLTDISAYHNHVELHRSDYINHMYKATANNPSWLQDKVKRLADRIGQLSLTEYVQVLMFTELSVNIIRGMLIDISSPMIYQTIQWYNDNHNNPKKRAIIEELLYLELNCRSRDNPVIIGSKSSIPHLLSPCGTFLDVVKMRKNFIFCSEKKYLGIKAADCVANFLRRTLKGTQLHIDNNTLEMLFNTPHSIFSVHFDKNREYIDIYFPEQAIADFFATKLL
jgi:hypothetical protein